METATVTDWVRRHPLAHPTTIPDAILFRLEAAGAFPADDEDVADVLVHEWAERYVATSTRRTPTTEETLRAYRVIAQTLHLESLRRRGVGTVTWSPDPYAEGMTSLVLE